MIATDPRTPTKAAKPAPLARPQRDPGRIAVRARPDVAVRRETMARLETILQDDGPIVLPVSRSIFTFHDKRVLGFRPHPTLYIFGNQLAIHA